MKPWHSAVRWRPVELLLAVALALAGTGMWAQTDDDDDELEERNLEKLRQAFGYRRDLAYRLEDPMVAGLNVEKALGFYLAGRKLKYDDPEKQLGFYKRGMAALEEELEPLPQSKWPPNPAKIKLIPREKFKLDDEDWQSVGLEQAAEVKFQVVEFTVEKLKQYGVVVSPRKTGRFPLILYLHGAAFGVPSYSLPWLARLAAEGYVIAAPALRGERLFGGIVNGVADHKCEGEIENLKGEASDALGMADGALKLPQVKPGKFAIVGHSFGVGAGLLAAARSKKVACIVSYDAWLTNPFRFYWERLAAESSRDNKDYLWGSWEPFVERPVKAQLAGLMTRSIVHHADRVNAPLLLFIGGAYNGSAYHYSHKELVRELKKHKKTFRFKVIPGGGHNFVLYSNREPAKAAYKLQMQWLNKYHPPAGKRAR